MAEPNVAVEAERAVLSAIVTAGNTYYDAAELIGGDDFYRQEHRVVWDAIERVVDEGAKVDQVSLIEELRSSQTLKSAGGISFISALTDELPDVTNVKHYAKAVRDASTTRRLHALGKRLALPGSADALLEIAQGELDLIATRSTRTTAEPVGAIADRVVERSIAIHNGEREVEGVTTGFPMLDDLVTTMGPGELWVLAARPSVGKTSLAVNILEHITMTLNQSALVVSLEMSREELAERLIGGMAGVNTRALKSGRLNTAGVPNDIERIKDASGRLLKSKLIVEDNMSITPSQLRAIARRVMAKQGLGLIVIDYLQLMDAPGSNANERAGYISRSAKKIAKTLHVPVLLLSQMSRRFEVDGRDRPMLSDLRDSGNIEQDSDKVMFLVRDINNDPGIAQLQLAKNRQGPVGDIPLRFDGEYTKFSQGEWIDHKEDQE